MQLAHGGGQAVEAVRHAGGVVTVTVTEDEATFTRARTTARMPDSRALEVHLLPVTEGVAALCTAGTGRVEVIVVSGLQNFPRYEPATVSCSARDLGGDISESPKRPKLCTFTEKIPA